MLRKVGCNKKIKRNASTKENVILFIYVSRDVKYVSTIVLSLLRPAQVYVQSNFIKKGVTVLNSHIKVNTKTSTDTLNAACSI